MRRLVRLEEWTINKTTGERSKERVCAFCYKREPVPASQTPSEGER